MSASIVTERPVGGARHRKDDLMLHLKGLVHVRALLEVRGHGRGARGAQRCDRAGPRRAREFPPASLSTKRRGVPVGESSSTKALPIFARQS